MKKFLRYGLPLLLLVIGCIFGFKKFKKYKAKKEHLEWLATAEHTASKNVKILTDTMTIDYLNEKRSLAIYVPEQYHQDSIDYPVIYFLDGESLFDQVIQEGMEWEVDEVLDSLQLLGQEQAIVVGIYSSDHDRLVEYKPFPSTKIYSDKVVHGDKHAEWIINKVKPWVDQQYRSKTDLGSTFIAGASLGGLMSYYMLNKYPDTFGGAIVFSPSFWVNEIVYDLHKTNKNIRQQKIYFDAGELETPTVESIEKMRKILLDYGMPAENIKLDIEKGLGHWHMTWKNGFKKAYPWIVQ